MGLAEEIITGRRASPAPPRQDRPANEIIDLLEEGRSQRRYGQRAGVQPSYRSATPPPMEIKLRDPRSPTTSAQLAVAPPVWIHAEPGVCVHAVAARRWTSGRVA